MDVFSMAHPSEQDKKDLDERTTSAGSKGLDKIASNQKQNKNLRRDN